MANQIPITYFVTASTVKLSATLLPLQLSTILILTDEQPITTQDNDYIISRTTTTIVNAYGTNSETAALGNSIFSQQPNILANSGYVIVAPMKQNITPDPIAATAGTFTTQPLQDNIDNFSTVTSGDLTLTIDGNKTTITGLDFAAAQNLTDIANVIGAKLTELATVSVTGDNEIVFTSLTIGANSKVEMSATTDGTGIDLYGTDYLNGAQGIAVTGTDEVQPANRQETLTEAITRLKGQMYFNGIITTRDCSDDEYIEAAKAVNGYQDRILFVPKTNKNALTTGGLFQTLKNYTFVKMLYYGYGATETAKKQNARNFAAAYASRGFAVNYNGTNTTLTMNLKDLNGIEADTTIDETLLNSLASVGADCFPSVEGLAKVVTNPQNGYYFDEVQNLIWFTSAIQRGVFNVLAGTSGKIPQTEAGLEKIDNAIEAVCKQAVTNGYLAPGAWNSPDTFGNYDDFIRNISEFGYYYYHTPVSEQAQAEREQRKAPLYSIAGKQAGAVQSANILIYIED